MRRDRASVERKNPGWVAELAARPDARILAAGPDGVLVDSDEPSALARLTPAGDRLLDPILLGLDGDVPLFAAELDRDASAPDGRDRAAVISLREAGAVLPRDEAGLAAYVTALLNWHRRHRFCANCGAPTDLAEAGYSRHCANCARNHFPRTDPVVIMTVEHDGRLLLGRRTGWPPGRLSVLAGFISPGESAEEAVVREVQEESGIVTRDPVYVASQPWPFPASLMLGFHAESDGGDPRPTDGELDEVRWIELADVQRAAAGENVDFALPPAISIARDLIDRWVALNRR